MQEGPTAIDENWLVLRAQAGDPEAMNRLLSGIAPALTRFIVALAAVALARFTSRHTLRVLRSVELLRAETGR